MPAEAPKATSTWPTTPEQRESLEGMLYRPAGAFTVTETYATMNYGEVGLARGDTPLDQWTDAASPGSAEAEAATAENARPERKSPPLNSSHQSDYRTP